jgi:hypothetical protein
MADANSRRGGSAYGKEACELKPRRSGSIRRSLGAMAERISRDVKRSPWLELVGGARSFKNAATAGDIF